MSTKPKKNFRYIDTFYYYRTDHIESSTRHYAFHIIEDVDSKKIYAIEEQDTNIRFEKIFDNTKVLRIGNIDSVSARKDWKEVNYNDKGSFWIDEELSNCYQNDGNNVVINYYDENHKMKINSALHNRNSSNDISLLEKATFILGYAECDADK